MNSTNIEALNRFSDKDDIAKWAQGSTAALAENNYVHGFNGKINPNGEITLAELAQIMYNIIKTYISKAGTYTFSTDDNVLINCPDVILKDCTIKGDLIVGDGVGNGDITLDNTKIEGRLLARGGGQNTISIKNSSTVGNVIISKTGSGDIRIKTEDGAQVEYVYIDDGKDDVILEGTFGQITIETDTPVKIRNARVSLVSVKAAGANISVEGKSLITTIDVDKAAPDCTIIVADVSIISEILINNPQAKVIGWEKADANTNSSGSQPPAGVEDHIAPAYISCEVTGEKTLRIDFSEPVCDGTGSTSINTANFIVDQLKPEYDQISAAVSFSTDYSYTIQSAVISGSSITLTLQETLAEGKVKLTINALGTETSDPIQDFAGNKVSTQDVTFNNTNDGSIISEATVKTAQYNSVTLGFSKPVTAKNIALFHGDKTVLANRSTPVSISDGDFVDEITFAFPSEIPAGPTSLFLVNSSEPDEKMFNIYGEYVPDQELAAVVTPDNEAPFVTDTELVNNNTFRIYFNERVSRSFAVDPANYDFNSYDMIKNNRYYTTVSIGT